MATSDDEEEPLLRSVALQNAQSILQARERAESELLEAREALRESQERLTAALAAASTGTFRWLFASGTAEWDEIIGPLFGVPAAAGTHRFGELIHTLHPEDRPVVQSRMQRCRLDGSPFDMEFRVVHPGRGPALAGDEGDGGPAADGTPVYMTGACRDVTRLKAAEEALREETRTLELLNETGTLLAGQLELERVLQAVTDAATDVSGAAVRRLLLQRHRRRRRSLPALHRCRARRARSSSASASRARPPCSRRPSAALRRSASTTCSPIRATTRWTRTAACRRTHPPVRSYLAVARPIAVGRGPRRAVLRASGAGRLHRARRAARARCRRPGRRRPRQRPPLRAGAARRRGAQGAARQRARRPRRGRAHERRQGRLPGHALARAAHAAERDPRLGPDAAPVGPQRRGDAAPGSRPSNATRASRRSSSTICST